MDMRVSLLREGSPAWAGIDPAAASEEVIYARFPRVGGDRPS